MGTIHELPFPRKTPLSPAFSRELPSMIDAVEVEWRHQAKAETSCLRRRALLRQAHQALAGLLNMQEGL